MKTKKFLSMAALALVGAMITGCSNDDDILQPENKTNVVTLTATVGFDDGATTRALTIDGNKGVKTFADGDQIAVIYKNSSDQTLKAVGTITSGVGTASATFSVTLSAPDNTKAIRYIYPAAMAKETIATNATIDDAGTVDFTKLNSQNGSLTTLGSNLDLCTFDAANWTSGTLPNGNLANQLAILAINLKNSTDITNTITGMTISDGTNNYAVSGISSASTIYVAIQPTSGATIEVTATDGTDDYVKTLSGKTYAANNGYNVTWNMTKLPKVTWNSTNVFKADNQNDELSQWKSTPLTYAGIEISFSGTSFSKFTPYNPQEEGKARLECWGSDGDSFTFTAPSGKKFTKIEIIDNSYVYFTEYGDWTQPENNKIVWRGTPASTVTLGGSDDTIASDLNSIVFTLKDE